MSRSKTKTVEQTRAKLNKVLSSSCLFSEWTGTEELKREQFFDYVAKKCTHPYSEFARTTNRAEIALFMFEFSGLYCRETESDRTDYHVWSEAEMKAIRKKIRRFEGSSVSDLLTQVLFPLQKDDKYYSYFPGKDLDKITKCFWKKVDGIMAMNERNASSSAPEEEPIQVHKGDSGKAARRAIPAEPEKSAEQLATEAFDAYVQRCLRNDDCKTPEVLHGSTKEFLMELVDLGGFKTLSPEQVDNLTTWYTIKVFQVIIPTNIQAPTATRSEVDTLKDELTHVQNTSYEYIAKHVFPLQTTNYIRYTACHAVGLKSCMEKIFRQIVDQMCKDKAERSDACDGEERVASDPLPYSFPLSDEKARKAFVEYWKQAFGRSFQWFHVMKAWTDFYKTFKDHFSDLSSDSEHQANHGLVKEILEAYVSNSAQLVRGAGYKRALPATVDRYRHALETKYEVYGAAQIQSMVYPNQADPVTKKIEYIGEVALYSFVDSLLVGLEKHMKYIIQCEAKLFQKDANRAVGEKTRRLAGPVSVNKFPVGTKQPGGNMLYRFADSDLEDEGNEQDGEEPRDERTAPSAESALKKPKHAEPARKGGPKRAGPALGIAPSVGSDEAEVPKTSKMGFVLAEIPANLDTTVLTLTELLEIGKARMRATVMQSKPDAADPYPESAGSQAIVEAALARPRLHASTASDDD